VKIYTYTESEWNEENQRYEITYSESYEYEGEISQCGGGGGGGTQKTYIRYAPYVETHHADFLNWILVKRNEALNRENPFKDYSFIEVDAAFFGTGYVLSSFPSLYDMFGKFMAGLDIEALWDQMIESTVNSPIVNDLISAESALMDDDINANAIPRLQTGMRDMNAVMSSSFVIGKAIIEDARVKSLTRMRAKLKYDLIPIASSRWVTHLEWNKGVIGIYSEIMKFYFSAKTDIDEINYTMRVKERLWPFTILDFERAALGALQGAVNSKTDVAGASTVSKVISGALSGAAMGSMVGSAFQNTTPVLADQAKRGVENIGVKTVSSAGSYWGAGIGAVLGVGAALTY